MRISRLFVDQQLNPNSSIFLNEKQSHYLSSVLRLKVGQSIVIFNGEEAFDYRTIIVSIGKKIKLHVEESFSTHNESPIKITIIQALSKNEHIDFMLQKCTELGASSFIIFNSQRTQIPLKNNKVDKKLNHWMRIVQSACEQCGRSIVPKIEFIPRFEAALSQHSSSQRLMLDFEGIPINKALTKNERNSVDLLLGAEGGLTKDEIAYAQQLKFKKTKLGSRILRTETAAISAVSLIQMLVGDLN